MVAGRRLPVAGRAAGEELAPDVLDTGDGCQDRRDREDRDGDGYNAPAAAMRSSKSGTSVSS